MQKDEEKCPCLVLAIERRVWLEEIQRAGSLEIPGLNKPEMFGSRWEKNRTGNTSLGA